MIRLRINNCNNNSNYNNDNNNNNNKKFQTKLPKENTVKRKAR